MTLLNTVYAALFLQIIIIFFISIPLVIVVLCWTHNCFREIASHSVCVTDDDFGGGRSLSSLFYCHQDAPQFPQLLWIVMVRWSPTNEITLKRRDHSHKSFKKFVNICWFFMSKRLFPVEIRTAALANRAQLAAANSLSLLSVATISKHGIIWEMAIHHASNTFAKIYLNHNKVESFVILYSQWVNTAQGWNVNVYVEETNIICKVWKVIRWNECTFLPSERLTNLSQIRPKKPDEPKK